MKEAQTYIELCLEMGCRCNVCISRRWSRVWKAKAVNYRAMWVQAEVSEDLKRARIAELEEALRKVRPLLQDTVDAHRDPSDADYNECDTDPCAWCEEAKELVEKPNE